MKPLFDYLFGSKLERETARYLEALSETTVAASRRQTDALLESLSRSRGPHITIGSTLGRTGDRARLGDRKGPWRRDRIDRLGQDPGGS
jgi:hypothetical protein